MVLLFFVMQITTSNVFSALAEPTRRHIIEMLASSGRLSATDISDKFKISPPAISQHLKVLRDADLVHVERKAQKRIYTINTKSLHKVEDWVTKINLLWNERFDTLDGLLAREKRKILK